MTSEQANNLLRLMADLYKIASTPVSTSKVENGAGKVEEMKVPETVSE